jgi:hypothetical protein
MAPGLEQQADLVERQAAIGVAEQLEHLQAIERLPRILGPSPEGIWSRDQVLLDVAADRPRLDAGRV